MRGRKLTIEEMECPEKLLDVKCPTFHCPDENYVFLIPPASFQRSFVDYEIKDRIEEWFMEYTELRVDDYLSAIISFCRYIYEHQKSGEGTYHILLLECPFEDEYTEWLENGMLVTELESLVQSLNALLRPLLFPLTFVNLEDQFGVIETPDGHYVKAWRILGVLFDMPKIYKDRNEKKRLNGGITRDGRKEA